MKKHIKITLSLLSIILLSCILLTSCSNAQKKFEEAYILELENTIEKFKSENSGVIGSITYDITFSKQKVKIIYHIKANKTTDYVSYYDLLHSDVKYEKNGISSPAYTYGVVYVNNKLKYSYGTCQFKENGQKNCTNEATKGKLCEYHYNMLDDIYNDFVG